MNVSNLDTVYWCETFFRGELSVRLVWLWLSVMSIGLNLALPELELGLERTQDSFRPNQSRSRERVLRSKLGIDPWFQIRPNKNFSLKFYNSLKKKFVVNRLVGKCPKKNLWHFSLKPHNYKYLQILLIFRKTFKSLNFYKIWYFETFEENSNKIIPNLNRLKSYLIRQASA